MQNYNIEQLREILDEMIACKADQQEIYRVSVELDKLIEGYYVKANVTEKQYVKLKN
ncbi:Spo0E family sporulation regulatory protein-aspartic acid phosphatase [Vallitalea sp.]|jgi:hypothetical protein|uniref:Spo0E family sporulation regulatory protein-aspartic acid phosphatase n=1 Tax=Vallitalea sp. TaxID=1882829 RepID=UPI0025D94D64|nr:Spo0E family sporulation regulatory protein-aspartic acid phosphatase [Vallitalea sp.]MCT4688192.1 Spo0E family sporulation regulatory protein-aspartic acid phosphatase [Vallitalea sp.]